MWLPSLSSLVPFIIIPADGLKGGDLEVDVSIILRWINEMEFEDITRLVWFWAGSNDRFL
jgi:hypothetical protein